MSAEANDNLVELRFDLDPDEWPYIGAEWMWAQPETGPAGETFYVLRNTPFFAFGLSFGDTLAARMEPDGRLTAIDTVARGGYATIQLLVRGGSDDLPALCRPLKDLGCECEGGMSPTDPKDTILSVSVPPTSDLSRCIALAHQGEADGLWEALLADVEVLGAEG